MLERSLNKMNELKLKLKFICNSLLQQKLPGGGNDDLQVGNIVGDRKYLWSILREY